MPKSAPRHQFSPTGQNVQKPPWTHREPRCTYRRLPRRTDSAPGRPEGLLDVQGDPPRPQTYRGPLGRTDGPTGRAEGPPSWTYRERPWTYRGPSSWTYRERLWTYRGRLKQFCVPTSTKMCKFHKLYPPEITDKRFRKSL